MPKLVALAVSLIWSMQVYDDADHLVGRWCDRPVPGLTTTDRIIEIRQTTAGGFYIYSLFGDDSELVQRLNETGTDRWLVFDSATRDGYRIAGGELVMFDFEGEIRRAPRVLQAEGCRRRH